MYKGAEHLSEFFVVICPFFSSIRRITLVAITGTTILVPYLFSQITATYFKSMSRVSCQKGPTRHAYAWQIGPFWQDTLDVCMTWLHDSVTV